MKVSDQANALRDLLEAWAQPMSGICSVVANFRAMWDQASQSSQKPMVLICYMGERVRGAFGTAAATHRVDQTWNAAVVRGRGFTSQRGDTLTTTVGNIDPFLDHLEAVKDIIRNAESPDITNGVSAEYPVDIKSVRPMQLGNLVIDGYIIEFSTANDLNELTKGNA